MILVGTAGFKFDDWKGKFYPPGLPSKDMLAFYASHFPVLEIDYTYYTMPFARTMSAMAAKVPDDFVFCVKAHKSMTHEMPQNLAQLIATFNTFNLAIQPLAEAGKLGCILMQFPWSFRRSAQSVDYLKRLGDLLPERPVVVEFRNREWVSEEIFALLKKLNLGYCCVDEPRLWSLMPPVAVATSNLGYVRFHGRNAARWYKHDTPSERYDYLYSEDELLEWAGRIRKVEEDTDKVFVLFNNCHEGKAAQNARDMMRLLGLPKVVMQCQSELI